MKDVELFIKIGDKFVTEDPVYKDQTVVKIFWNQLKTTWEHGRHDEYYTK